MLIRIENKCDEIQKCEIFGIENRNNKRFCNNELIDVSVSVLGNNIKNTVDIVYKEIWKKPFLFLAYKFASSSKSPNNFYIQQGDANNVTVTHPYKPENQFCSPDAVNLMTILEFTLNPKEFITLNLLK